MKKQAKKTLADYEAECIRRRDARPTHFEVAVCHIDHGQEGADDYPNASYCPCVGLAPAIVQKDCAAAGCRYCTSALSRVG